MLVLLQPLLVDACNAHRLQLCFNLCLVLDTLHAIVAVLLLTERLTLLIGFLLLHHLYYLSVGFGEINSAFDFDAKVVKVVLIVVLELLDHIHLLFL